MSKCNGCGESMEHILEIRVYHGKCDPQSRAQKLERLLSVAVLWLGELEHNATVKKWPTLHQELAEMRAALAYKPAGS